MGWFRREKRSAGGGYTDAVVAAIEAQAAAKVADASSTAAVEAVAGMLSRAFGDAEVVAESWAAEAVTPFWLMQVGRSLIREGASLSVIEMTGAGRVNLVPAAFWNFERYDQTGGDLEDGWEARVTTYGPGSSHTRLLARSRLVYVRWGTSPGTRYRGQGPTSWAHLTARLQGEVERSLGDEASGPIAQILAVPQDGGDDGDDDPLKQLKADIGRARGKAVLTETTAAGWGEGKASAPMSDWKPQRLGPNPPAATGGRSRRRVLPDGRRVRVERVAVHRRGRHRPARGVAPLASRHRATARPAPRPRVDDAAGDPGPAQTGQVPDRPSGAGLRVQGAGHRRHGRTRGGRRVGAARG